MKKTIIRLEGLNEERNFEDYYNFITDSYPIVAWAYDYDSDDDKNEFIFYSVDSEGENVKDVFEQTCEGFGFKIGFYEHSNVTKEEWASCKERLDLEEDAYVEE